MLALTLAAVTVAGTAVPQNVYATEVTEQGDDVVITESIMRRSTSIWTLISRANRSERSHFLPC